MVSITSIQYITSPTGPNKFRQIESIAGIWLKIKIYMEIILLSSILEVFQQYAATSLGLVNYEK